MADDKPRHAGESSIDDPGLSETRTEREARLAAGSGGAGDSTCITSYTLVCDTHPPGQTCTSGFTLKCDTGMTCTRGWTLRCDTTVTTCTSGWTIKCDSALG